MSRIFRRGGVGAMMDEYERAAAELPGLLLRISDEEFERVRDLETPDENCRSIQTVMRHVVRAGYAYASDIRTAFGTETQRTDVPLAKRLEVPDRIAAMLAYTAATLEGKWEMPDAEITALKIHTPWGSVYDLEQMLEHAIVHVLRHRRQIERFLTEPRFAGRATA
ncbi:MAG TPA: DinB family protein [Candidatus Eisenbacteria bacterium]